MRRIHIGVLAVALAMSSCCGWVEKMLSDPDLRKADTLFDKGLFEEAHQAYEAVYADPANEDVKWKAFYRSTECLTFLYKYGEAAQKVFDAEPPEKMPYRARFFWLKAEILQNFARQYSYIQPDEIIEGTENEDVFRKTPAQVRTEARSAYEELWKMKADLVKMRLEDEDYFLDVDGVDLKAYPTAFDFVVFSWTDYLLSSEASIVTEETVRPRGEDVTVDEFDKKVNLEDPPAMLAAQLMEEAGRFEIKKRKEAAERWRVKRVVLPVRSGHFDVEDWDVTKKATEEILLGWWDDFKTGGGKADAGVEAARLLDGREQYVDAVKLCEKIEDRYSKTWSAHEATELRESIQEPFVQLEGGSSMPPASGVLSLETRNQKKVWFRVYDIEPKIFRQFYDDEHGYYSGWSSLFSYVSDDMLRSWFDKHEPLESFTQSIDDKGDHKYVETVVESPDLDEGVYLVVASVDSSFKLEAVQMFTTFVNVTNMVLVGTAGPTVATRDGYHDYITDSSAPATMNDDLYRFYAIDARTGEPVVGADLDIYATENGNTKEVDLTTDDVGSAVMPMQLNIQPRSFSSDDPYAYGGNTNYYGADPLASQGTMHAYWSGSQSLSTSVPNPVEIYVQTDRPIYRPGHTVQVKVNAVRRIPTGFKAFKKGIKARISAMDANGKEFWLEEPELNDFGSASASFVIPAGKLLGSYTLRAFVDDGRFQGVTTVNFRVEEYKQPEFEVTLDEPEKPWKYDEPVKVKGSVTYYFGGPVQDAQVDYTINRSTWVPWFYRWYSPSYSSGSSVEVERDTLHTDDEGNFVIEFTPTAPPLQQWQQKLPDMANFAVQVHARDSGGRTIAGSQSYRAGKNGVYITIAPTEGFFDEGSTSVLDTALMTINDTPHEGTSAWEVFRLADEPTRALDDGENYYSQSYSNWDYLPPIDVQLAEVENGKKVASGKVTHGKDGQAKIEVDELDAGGYRIVMKTKDPWGGEVEQERLFVVAAPVGKPTPLNAASVMLVQEDEYEPGQTARIVLGSGLAQGIYHLEIWTGSYMKESSLLKTDGKVKLVEIPVTEDMLGGSTLRWFGTGGLDVHHGESIIRVPYKDSKLTVTLDPIDEEIRPGQEVNWGIVIADRNGKPVKAEALAFMYDRALEYYASAWRPWMDGLWFGGSSLYAGFDSIFDPSVTTIWVDESVLEKVGELFDDMKEPPRPPGLRTWMTWSEGRNGLLSNLLPGAKYDSLSAVVEEEGAMQKAAPAPTMASMDESDSMDGREKKKGDSVSRGIADAAPASPPATGGQAAPEVEARQAFSDTGFFSPHVVTGAGGTGAFSFVAPEQLTSWRVKVFAFTKSAQEGTFVTQVVTKKELMVRADIPRFFREKDQGTITAMVHNETDEVMEGDLYIDVKSAEQSIAATIGLTETTKHFTIEPHSMVSHDWMIDVPEGVDTWKVRVTAVSGELTDAEQRDLPILPSRQRLIESAFISLKGTESKKLEIKLKADPTRINESMILQVDPQLALSLLNTIPYLVEYPHECVEQTLNRYVPLAVINEIYIKYPHIKKAVAKVPKRDTVTPAWEQDDPRRLITLMETPWVRESEGYTPPYPMTDLLDPKIVESQKELSLSRLRSAQYGSGAFPWWPGGPESPYMTLLVLAGLSEARRYDVMVPMDMIDSALGYVISEIPRHLTKDTYDLALTAYAAYVITSFPKDEFVNARDAHKIAKKWTKHLEGHIHALTPFGKAYLASTHFALGKEKRAGEIIDMIMDSAKEDPMLGVYWQPEKYSWIWYSDSVEKHSFILRTLHTIRPDDERIPGMIQWLLFNRKGNQWKSTKASAAAVFTLLEYMDKTGALTTDDSYEIAWVDTTESFVVKPDDWIEEPIRFFKTGEQITDAHATVTVSKEGKSTAFASLAWIYTTDQLAEESAPGLLNVSRTYFRRVKKSDGYHLEPIASGGTVNVGDEIVVQMKVTSESQFEFMHVNDPRIAGFEAETLLSGWKYKPLWVYEEPRDSLTNFFMDWLPAGEYVLTYKVRPTKAGTYRVGATILQSMYAPEMTAHSAGHILKVEK